MFGFPNIIKSSTRPVLPTFLADLEKIDPREAAKA
jgi:hypothetical protein